ncbi:phosphotransferase [Streptomyces sp. NPDC004667]|uniref:phosphotransferase family protein n=1 Tax=Streptomyces sp. NPDC004667 TaxID=3154285 RepID=UPI0033A8B8FB
MPSSSHTGSTTWSRCTRSRRCRKVMSTSEPTGAPSGWAQLAEDAPADLDSWARRNLGRLSAIEKGWLDAARGSTLTHGDLRPDNMVMRGGEAVVVDWSYLSQAAGWCDAVSLVPHLILAGHDPASAEEVIAPLLGSVPDPDVVTAFAAAFGGFWERSSRNPSPANAPHLRGYWPLHRRGSGVRRRVRPGRPAPPARPLALLDPTGPTTAERRCPGKRLGPGTGSEAAPGSHGSGRTRWRFRWLPSERYRPR